MLLKHTLIALFLNLVCFDIIIIIIIISENTLLLYKLNSISKKKWNHEFNLCLVESKLKCF